MSGASAGRVCNHYTSAEVLGGSNHRCIDETRHSGKNRNRLTDRALCPTCFCVFGIVQALCSIVYRGFFYLGSYLADRVSPGGLGLKVRYVEEPWCVDISLASP